MITKDQVIHMAEISKLKFSEEEMESFTKKFSEIVEYVETLNQLDIEDVEPTYQVNEHTQFFREDIVKEGITREEVLQNAPEDQYGYFKILKIVE